MQARADLGVAASCLLAALGTEPDEIDGHYIRAYAGALLLAEALIEIRTIRKALTTTSET